MFKVEKVIATTLLASTLQLLPLGMASAFDRENKSCEQSISATKKQLSSNGITVTSSAVRIHEYTDAPLGRTKNYVIGLTPKSFNAFIQKKTFGSAIASQIIYACREIGIVSIGIDKTDSQITLGLVGNEVVPFRCVDFNPRVNRTSPSVRWGYTQCL